MSGAWPRIAICFALVCAVAGTVAAGDDFALGTKAYEAGSYEKAAAIFRSAAEAAPASGRLENLGDAEWKSGNVGPAVLAWERAQWLDPASAAARGNLAFARKARLLDAPDLAWYEICSTWLPVNDWAWIAAGSFWLALAMVVLPGVFHWRKAGWHQALAAAGFALFLLAIPAMAGVYTRSKIGVVLAADTPLRLTPTAQAQAIARLAAGEAVRATRQRGGYVFIRAATASGWIERAKFELIAGR